ncbi:MAG: ABC transporter ATP-binding protein [Actinomyces sp.]|uniref:ABC transporter ATP-binding protein n=1 Tax=Actinomyces sp. TaxID=29317 RepID=UPI0026DC585A|nr:ABC transporter ATP-binding protein [Actinomyces sp.]MDO4243073.1 ABC transporter ATP-binding protein [Actinomyces sp.]
MPHPSPEDRPGARVPVGTRSGRRANTAAAALTVVSCLAEAWALICLARAITSLAASAGLLSAWPAVDTPGAALVEAGTAALISALAATAVQLIARRSAATEEGELRRRALAHLFDLGPAHAGSARSGATISLLTDGVERVALYRQTFLAPTIAAAAAPLLVLLLVGVTVDGPPAAVLAAAFILVPAVIVGFHRRFRRSSSASRAQRTRLSAEYLDAIQGLTTLVLARAAERRSRELRAAGEDNRRAVMGLLAGNQTVILVTDALFSLFLVTASTGMALARLESGSIGLDGALALVLVSLVLLVPLDHVGAFFYVGMGGLANQRALRALLGRRRTDRPDRAHRGDRTDPGDRADLAAQADRQAPAVPGGALPSTTPQAPGRPPSRQAAVSLRGVTATWGQRGAAVLSDVDLEVAPGERLAVVGPSGSGKSTLLSLLSGDLLPAAGTVRVGTVVASAATQDQVRAASAVVAQTTWLFTGTIADNLRLADPDATDERLWVALETAGLAQEVRRMPEGLGTQVGEQGMGLSGGQAQRVSLARAFLADRPLLLLDEPTSQVDLTSEARIIEAIDRISAGRTVVTVSHRAGALSGADRVIAVEAGGLR